MEQPLWTGRPDPEPAPDPVKRRGPRKSVLAAFSLIPIGGLFWFGGLAIGLGVGDAGGPHADVIVPVATYCFVAGLPIAAAGFIWLVMIAISDYLNQ